MLGRRNPQRSLFSAQTLPHRVAVESFYGRMASVSEVLFSDEDMAGMYCADNGRPSLPPSLLSGVMLLQFHDNVSDAEAVERLQFDLRWQVALDLPTDFAGFDPSSLTYFRRRLVEHGQERYAFDRFVAVGRAAGFIPDRVTLLTDTTRATGAGAVQDTYTLLRKGVRKLLKQMGYGTAGKQRGLSAETQRLVQTYLAEDRKAAIDWADPAQRAAQLRVLFADADLVLALAAAHGEDADVRATGWMLAKIMGDDIVVDEGGQPQIAQGVAPDRLISLTDPEMRHGHKSRAQRFDGFKVAVTTDQSSDLILDIQDIPAPGSDGRALLGTIARVEEHTDVSVVRVLGDGAYGSGANRAACAAQEVDLLAPIRRPADPVVDKSAFQIDLVQQTVTCPQGQTVSAKPGPQQQGQPTFTATFPRALCQACPLFQRCVRSKRHGRTVSTHPFEAHLQAARQRQESDEFKSCYRQRSAIERSIAHLVHHGVRQTRYRGQAKRQLQRLFTAAVVNLKRLFSLSAEHAVDLKALLSPRGPTALPIQAT